MAKTKHSVSKEIIGTFAGTLDFYRQGEHTVIRTWPRGRSIPQTPRSSSWAHFFKCFHRYYYGPYGAPMEHFRSASTGPTWSRRDYAAHLWYGGAAVPSWFVRDEREPWPPPCPDPLRRFFAVGDMHIDVSLGGACHLWYRRRPWGANRVYMTHKIPRFRPAYRTIKGKRCQVAPEIVHADSTITTIAGNASESNPPYTNHAFFYDSFDHPVFWFLGPPGGLYYYLSTSAWYTGRIVPGPGGTWLGAHFTDPIVLTPAIIDYLRGHYPAQA